MSLRNKLYGWARTSSFAPFIPKFFICMLEGYSRKTFASDLFAGITMGIIALPIAMAIAIGAGADPQRGIQTAIVGGFLSALFGGSRFLVCGPGGAFVVLMFTIIKQFGFEGLILATLQASVILVIMGLLRCGILVRLFSYPVIVGFSTGIGATLLLSQINDLFGLTTLSNTGDTLDRLATSIAHLHLTNPYTVAISLTTIGLILLLKRISSIFPNVIAAVVLTTAITYFFDIPVQTIYDKFGDITGSFPSPSMPNLSLELLRKTFPSGLSIALLCSIETLLTAVIADSLTSTRHKSNCELLGQGIANCGSALCGGLPSAGLIARTSASIQLGAKTPVSSMIHSATLLILFVVFAPFAGLIPIAVLSSVLVVVAAKMIEWKQMRQVMRTGLGEASVMLLTLLITFVVDINTAVEVGVLLTIILFLKKSSESTTLNLISFSKEEERDEQESEISNEKQLEPSEETKIYEIEGPFFFAVSDMLFETFQLFEKKPKNLIIRMRSVPFIDSTGLEALKRFAKLCASSDIHLTFTEIRPQVLTYLQQTDFFETVQTDQLRSSLQEALS
jgi:sulfate permease, SulP family